MPKPPVPERLDRHSGTGVRGLPVKKGLKGWGKVDEQEGVTVLDKGDPNYVEEEEEGTSTVSGITETTSETSTRGPKELV